MDFCEVPNFKFLIKFVNTSLFLSKSDILHKDLYTFTSSHYWPLQARQAVFFVGYELSLKKAADI